MSAAASLRPLPLRLRPESDESLVGFLVRLAARNGRQDLLPFARELGMPFSVLQAAATTRFDLGPLSAKSRVAEQRLEAMAAWSQNRRTVLFRGVRLPRAMISLSRRRVCPRCLAASRHHRSCWDVSVVTVCPDHAVRLVDRCPRCSKRLAWISPDPGRCGCGFDLAECPVTRVPEHELGGTRETFRLLGLISGSWVPSHAPVPPAILVLDTGEILSLVLHLGWYASGLGGLPRPVRDARTTDGFHVVLNQGYRIAQGWPEAFQSSLANLRTGASARPGRHGGRKEIGPLVAWLASLGEDSPIYRLVQPEVAEHWVAAGISARTPVLSSSATPMTMTLGAAAQRLRRSTSAVRGLLADLGSNEDPDGRGGGKGTPLHLSRLQVEVVAGQLDDLRDKRRLAAEFGCGRRLLDAIVTAGLLTPASGPAAKLGGPRRWLASEAAALVTRLEGSVVARAVQAVNLVQANRNLRQAGLGEAECVRVLLEGGLRPAGLEDRAHGLRRLLYGLDDIAGLLDGRRPVEPTLSIPQAARALGIGQELAYRLCKAEVLRILPAGGASAGRRIERNELERFRCEYLLPGKAAVPDRRHRGWMAARLLAAGVQPVTGPGVDGGRHYVFRRADADAAIARGMHGFIHGGLHLEPSTPAASLRAMASGQ